MLENYLTTAVRALAKNKLFSAINIVGLSIGLAVYVFSQLVADYERTHDGFFPDSERIYAIYAIIKADAGFGLRSSGGIQTSVRPLLAAEVPDIEVSARLIMREFLASYGDKKFYQGIRFADPAFLDIFRLDYIEGNGETALDDPAGVIMSESTARKFFGNESALGKVITFNNEHDLRVTAVFADIPTNSHFMSGIIVDQPLQMIGTTEALAKIADWDIEGSWNNLSMSDVTYVKLPVGVAPETVNRQLAGLYDRHAPDRIKEFLGRFELRPLVDLNLFVWETTGLPMITSIQILGLLILVIAILNYTNLATAQVMGRTREVGMRRTMGASRRQLFGQFLVESTALVAGALVLAVLIIQGLLPLANDVMGKAVSFDILSDPALIGWLVLIVLMVGALAGSYPAYLISRVQTVGLLNGSMDRGKKAGIIRNLMLVIQFTIALFMILAVAIIYAQNKAISTSSEVFAKDRIVTVSRMSRPEIRAVTDTLRTEIERIPGVEAFALSSQVPFEQSHNTGKFSMTAGDEADTLDLYQISIDRNFLQAYDIKLLAGRNFSPDYSEDQLKTDDEGNPLQETVNAIVNELVLERLGIESAARAIGQSFHRLDEDGPNLEHRIVGVIPDANFLGLHNSLKPIVFVDRPDRHRIGSITIKGAGMPQTLAAIDEAWDRVVPSFPIERGFLEDRFNDIFRIFEGINLALAGFAALALIVAVFGLFGMAAFMAERRTREIGIRKVMGAKVRDIVGLLIWQFSRPVFIAIVVASPLAFFASKLYLDFFADRAEISPLLFVGAGLSVLLLAWATISVHATRVARANPVGALRYE